MALLAKGFEVFLPQYKSLRRWKDRQKEISLPLFPNYVFIRAGLGRMLDIVTTPGFVSVVGWGGRPAIIPEEQVEAIRRLLESRKAIQPHPYLKGGDWVRVCSGPLEGLKGVLVRIKSADRLVLSVDIVEKAVSIEVDGFALERIDTNLGACSAFVDRTLSMPQGPLHGIDSALRRSVSSKS